MLSNLQVEVNSTAGALSKADLIRHATEAHALITFLSDKIDEEVLAACPNLKIISNYAVGYDNVDFDAASRHQVVVTNTPDVLTEAVAEHTIALMLAAGRRVVEADKFMRAGKYTTWQADLLLGKEFQGTTLGVIGCGRIGARVAEIAKHGFGMNVIYHDMQPNPDLEQHLGATYVEQDELFKNADVVTVNVPLTDATRHLIDTQLLSQMKPDALLLNTSRGPVIDEAALVTALRNKTIAAAGLDVYENEPQMASGLAELDNVVVTPHMASATITARESMATLAAQAVLDVAAGKTPAHVVIKK